MNYSDWFEYRDGALYWRQKPNRRISIGSRAGRVEEPAPGYKRRIVRLGGKHLKEHRVIWEMHYGPPGDFQIDHIDGNPLNNTVENLRIATGSQNQENRRCRGTHYCRTRSRWLAKIQVKGSQRTIGHFSTEAEAHAAYLAVKRVEHEFCTI